MTVGWSSANLITPVLNIFRGTTFTGIATPFIQLHTGDPGASGTANVSSVTTRMAITWNAPSSNQITISSTTQWTAWAGTNGEVVSHVSLWSASTVGTFYDSFALTLAKTINTGDTFTLNSCTIGLSPVAA